VSMFSIETERLLIRPFTLDDAEALHAVWGDPASERFTAGGGRTPATVAETKSFLARIVADQEKHGFASSAVIEKETGRLIGDCGIFVSPDQPELELAYGFARDRWGLGYATEAAAACVRAGFEQLDVDRIVADVDVTNRASIRVLEKLGFELEREESGKRYYAVTHHPPQLRK
jgi:[ribosomal protein S5]-alanine N-acetyltransferase